jgi:hypothetical protein
VLKRRARQNVCEGFRSRERKQRVESSQVEHLRRASYQHRKLGFVLRENSYLGQLDRATVHPPCSNCGKSPGSCGDETVVGMDGSILELRHYIDKTKTRWENPHHDHAPGLQRRCETLRASVSAIKGSDKFLFVARRLCKV